MCAKVQKKFVHKTTIELFFGFHTHPRHGTHTLFFSFSMSSSEVSVEHPTIQMIKAFGLMTSRSWPKCMATVKELVKLAHPAALAISGFLMLPSHQLKENKDDSSLDARELGDVLDKYIQFPVVHVKSFEKATAEAEMYSNVSFSILLLILLSCLILGVLLIPIPQKNRRLATTVTRRSTKTEA